MSKQVINECGDIVCRGWEKFRGRMQPSHPDARRLARWVLDNAASQVSFLDECACKFVLGEDQPVFHRNNRPESRMLGLMNEFGWRVPA